MSTFVDSHLSSRSFQDDVPVFRTLRLVTVLPPHSPPLQPVSVNVHVESTHHVTICCSHDLIDNCSSTCASVSIRPTKGSFLFLLIVQPGEEDLSISVESDKSKPTSSESDTAENEDVEQHGEKQPSRHVVLQKKHNVTV